MTNCICKGNGNLIFEDYNGWTNRDTWLVGLWLNNDESNYKAILSAKKGVGTSTKLMDLSCCDIKAKLKRLHYGDKINWKNVNMDEIIELLNDIE